MFLVMLCLWKHYKLVSSYLMIVYKNIMLKLLMNKDYPTEPILGHRQRLTWYHSNRSSDNNGSDFWEPLYLLLLVLSYGFQGATIVDMSVSITLAPDYNLPANASAAALTVRQTSF